MLLTTPYPKFAAKYICAVGLITCFAQYAWARPPSRTPVDVNIVAHQDDDILFINPDILNSVVAGHRQVTVFITSGSYYDPCYALDREAGAIAGYQKLLQLAQIIQNDPHHFNDFTETFDRDSRHPAGCSPSPSPPCDTFFACNPHAAELSTPGTANVDYQGPLHIGSRDLAVAKIADGPEGPKVMLIFLRLQTACWLDGNFDPNYPCPTCSHDPNDPNYDPNCVDVGPNPVNLGQLFQSGDNSIQIGSVFNDPNDPNYTPPYTKQQLINQLVDILNFVQPNVVRTQDPANGIVIDYPGNYMIPDLGCNHCATGGGPHYYDHSDHVWGARFARQAVVRYDNLPNSQNQPTYFTYNGYNVEWNEAARTRLSTKYFCLKKSIFFNYAVYDNDHTCTGQGASLCDTPPAEPDPHNNFDCFSYLGIGYQKGQQQQSP